MIRRSLACIEQWAWYLFLATFAWQTRMILWQADRQFVEWRSMSLYASDVLMMVLFGLALFQLIRDKAWQRPQRVDSIDGVLIVFLLAALVSIRNTDQVAVSIYQFFRLVQFVLLYRYVRYRSSAFDADHGLLAFIIGALLQSMLALGQYALQHDVGIRWLGETLLNTHTPGVAVFYNEVGVKVLRAYGTLPHPNVLAAYLMAALWALAYLYLRHGVHKSVIWLFAGVPLLWALYLTFSRTMIAVGIVATGIVFLALWMDRFSGAWPHIKLVRRRARHILIVGVVATLLFGGLFWKEVAARVRISSREEAVQLRVYYAKQAIVSGRHAWLDVNWTGVGLGNFVSWLEKSDPYHPSWVYQPAHNLYLLVYSETGIIGILVFGAWLILIVQHTVSATGRPGVVRWGMVMIVVSFLCIALFDHFFWTIQQGRILFWMALAIAGAAQIGPDATAR